MNLPIDMASDGTIYGIELLNASEQLKRGDNGKFRIVNEATGKEEEIKLNV